MDNLNRTLRDILDNAANGARDLGSLSNTRTVRGTLSPRSGDFTDFYKFRLQSRGGASALLSKLQHNANLKLLNEAGRVVATSQNSGRQNELVSRTLDAGLYFLEVRWGRSSRNSRGSRGNQASSTRYTLSLSPTLAGDDRPNGSGQPGLPSAISPTDGGNSIPTAFNVGNLAGNRLYRTTIGGSDTADYFRLNLTQTSLFQARTLNVIDGDVQLELIYDANGNGLVDAGELLSKGNVSDTPLGAGSYLVGITPQSTGSKGPITYNLQLGAAAVTDLNPAAVDPGDLPASAFDLLSLNGTVNLKQFVGTTDPRDTYVFRLEQISGVGVNLAGAAGGSGFRLIYDVNENGLIDASDSLMWDVGDSSATPPQVKTLLPGRYFVEVNRQSPQSNSLYTLSLTSTPVTGINPVADPGSGLGTSSYIGNLTDSSQNKPRGTVNVRQLVGSKDSVDVYRFDLTDQVNTFKATLNAASLSDDVTMALVYDRDGDNFLDLGEQVGDRVVPGDFIGGTFLAPGQEAKASIEKTLGRGTYFLVITQKESIENTVYDLNVFAQGLGGTYAAPDPVQGGTESSPGPYLAQATPLQINGTTYSQFVGSTDVKDVYQFTVDSPRNMIIKLEGISEKVEVRFARDLNSNGRIDFAVDGEGKVLPEFDINGNEELDPDEGEVFQPSLGKFGNLAPDVIYSPLPPYFDAEPFFNLPIDNGWVTSVPTEIRAQLNPGTYYIEIERAGFSADLGDTGVRTGYSNTPYTLTLIPD